MLKIFDEILMHDCRWPRKVTGIKEPLLLRVMVQTNKWMMVMAIMVKTLTVILISVVVVVVVVMEFLGIIMRESLLWWWLLYLVVVMVVLLLMIAKMTLKPASL